MKLLEYLKSDLGRITKPTFFNFLKAYFFPLRTVGVYRYIFWLRVLQFSKKNLFFKYLIGIPSYFIFQHYTYKFGIHINTNIPIGKGLCIVHGGTVYINCKSIGENVTIHQCVTLGSKHGSDNIPILEDGVTIYTGAVVCGDIILHNRCTIGANSYVDCDVEADCTVAGSPAKVISYKK
ncbi:MAG: serine acetyltransferase [Ruminococcus sp.]|nr:serine acetyltransferase [Ruminococcus sp.]